MAIDNSFMIRRFQKMERVFMLLSPYTRLPYVECDEATFDDQVYFFAEEEQARAAVESFARNEITVQVGAVPNDKIDGLLTNLYAMGVNRVVIQDVGAPVYLELEQLKDAPDLEAMKNDKVPRANPACQLTGLYFSQELRRKIKRNAKQKKELVALEEEWAVNLMRSRLIVSLDITDNNGPLVKDKKGQKVKVPVIRNKKGDVYQPCFTDLWEFQKFNNGKSARFQLIPVNFADLPKHLIGESIGFVVNPAGYNLTLSKKQMETLQQKYGE